MDYDQQDIIRIKTYSKEYEKELLQLLGFENINSKGIQQSCPIHGGDNRSAFSYDLSKHCWSCFSQHCEKKYGNDIIGLVRGLKNLSFNEAIKWLKEILTEDKTIDWKKIDESINLQNVKTIHNKEFNKTISEDKLKNLIKDYSSLKDRNFKQETLETFEGGVSINEDDRHSRFMIPIRDDKNHIVGFTGRSIYNKCEKCTGYHTEKISCPDNTGEYSKWRHYPPFFHKHIELYNINRAKDYIYNTNTAIIVEGPFDVWRLWEHGVKNVVASFGTSLSYAQCRLLAKYNCINLVLMFDSDKAGLNAIKETTKMTKEIFKVYTTELPEGTDPGSLGLEQFNSYIKPIVDKVNGIMKNGNT